MSVFRLAIITFVLLTVSGLTISQQWRTEQPTNIDKGYMEGQQDRVDTLIRRHFGRQLTGQRSNDFAQMQRLLDEQIVSSDDSVTLQAMGIILGNILKSEQGLSWIIYIDKYGRSRALQIPGQRDVLFPVTMISRRVEAGAEVDINDIYSKALKELERIRKQIVVY